MPKDRDLVAKLNLESNFSVSLLSAFSISSLCPSQTPENVIFFPQSVKTYVILNVAHFAWAYFFAILRGLPW